MGNMKMDRTYYAQFRRLLELDKLIRAGQYPNALTFSVEWEVSQKTVQRDIDYLRYSLGAPMEYDRVRKGYYYTDKNWFLPALNVNEAEIRALLLAKVAADAFTGVPIARELDRMLAKLVESMPERLPFPPELIFSRFSFTAPAAKPVNPTVWSTVVSGLLAQQSIRIRYHSLNTGKSSERVIDPYHVANLHGEWYVFGWCHAKKKLLQFGIPQIQSVVVLTETFNLPEHFDPQKLLANAFRRQVLGDEVYKVTLRFDPKVADRVAERVWQPKQKVKRLRNGTLELTFPAVGLFEVSRWVLSWGSQVDVINPTELKEMIEKEHDAIRAKRYSSPLPSIYEKHHKIYEKQQNQQ